MLRTILRPEPCPCGVPVGVPHLGCPFAVDPTVPNTHNGLLELVDDADAD